MALQDGFPGVSGAVDTLELRKDLAGLVARDTTGAIRTGVFPWHTGHIVTARSDMAVDVGIFAGVSERGGGPVFMANDGSTSVAIPAAPGAGTSQYHVVWFKQNENTTFGGDGDDLPTFGVTSGAASGFPTVPSIASIDGATELATVLVPSGAAATNSPGVVITATYQFTATAGGVVMCRDDAELQAWLAPDGSYANHLDTADLYRRRAGAWVNSDVPSHGSCSRSTTQSIGNGFGDGVDPTQIVFNTPGPLQDVTYSTAGLTVLEAGTYLVDIRVAFAPNANGYRYLYAKVNGTDTVIGEIRLANGPGHSASLGSMAFFDLAAGDVITAEVAQTSGGNLNLNAGARMRVMRISEVPLFS